MQRKQSGPIASRGGLQMKAAYANLMVLSVAAATWFVIGLVLAYSQETKSTPRAADGKADLSGVWVVNGGVNLPVDPAYLPAVQKKWAANKANLTRNDPAADCLPN